MAPILIESAQNPRYKNLRRLLTARGIREEEAAIASGVRLTAELLTRLPDRVLATIGSTRHEEVPGAREVLHLAPPLFRELDVLGTDHPLLVVRAPRPEPWSPAEGFGPGATLLVPFQDPENVGTVIRSAAAFGVTEIVLLAEAASPFLPRAIRASAGASFTARLRSGPSLAALDPGSGVTPLSAEGTPLPEFVFPGRFALLPGLEGPGLPPAWRQGAVAVPTTGEVESLNAATATAIVLHAWRARAGG